MGRVELKITDDKKFQDIALLIDRNDVQKSLGKIRRESKKSEKYLTLADYLRNSRVIDMARRVLREYKYPFGFTSAITAAATRNKVTDKDLNDCYSKALILPFITGEDLTYTITQKEVLIAIYPYAIKGNLTELRKEMRKVLMQVTKLIQPLPKKHPLNLDVKTNIKEMREWYWERKLNKTKTEELHNRYHREPNTIDKAISNYGAALKSEF